MILRKRQIYEPNVPHKILKQWKQKLHQFAEPTIESKDGGKKAQVIVARDNVAVVAKADNSMCVLEWDCREGGCLDFNLF